MQTLLMAQEVNYRMTAELDALPSHEEMTPEQKLEAARIYRRITVELLEICLPPGVELTGN